jgi:hypothetical protein
MKHIILRTTNGEGYSNHPLILITEDLPSAESTFNEQVGQLCYEHFDTLNQESELTYHKKENCKIFMLDHSDNEAVIWLQNVQPKTMVIINADFSNEIKLETNSEGDIVKFDSNLSAESSHEADTYSFEDEESGTVYHYIYIK